MALTQFLQAEKFLPEMQNFCDQLDQFNSNSGQVLGSGKSAADFLARIDKAIAVIVHLKMTDLIPFPHIKIDLASGTPKKDEYEEDFNPDEVTSSDQAIPTSLPDRQADAFGHRS